MADNLADRLRQKAEEQHKAEQAQHDKNAFQQKVNAFITENARPEYEKFAEQLRKKIDEINPHIGDLPKYQWDGAMLQQGNCVAGHYFTQTFTNRPENRLQISFATHPHVIYFSQQPPRPRVYKMQAAATDQLDGMVWVGDAGELSTDQLVDFVFENLTDYYLRHKPRL